MKVLLLSLLLYVVGLNPILARFIPRNSYEPINWWNDYEFDNFNSAANYYSDDFDKLTKDESLEESKLTLDSSMSDDVAFLDAVLRSFLLDDDSVTSLPEKHENFNPDISSEIRVGIDDTQKNHNHNNNNNDEDGDHDDDDNDEPVVHSSAEEKPNQFEILLYNPSTNNFETPDTKSSEENKSSKEEANKSSEEIFTPIIEEDRSEETRASETKSSEENKVEDNEDVSEKELKELTSLLLTLSAMDDIIEISNKYPEAAGWQPHDEELKKKEVDAFSSVLDSILKELFVVKENENVTGDEDDKQPSLTTITHDNDSKEEADNDDDRTPSPNNASTEVSGNNIDKVPGSDNISDDANSSVNNENDINLISFEFHGLDGGAKPENLNEHKYEIVDATPAFQPTTAPYIPEMAYSTNSDNHNVIQEYVEIREDLDTQQDSLQENKFMLDKDFYSIIANNYDDESMNKFGKDIYQVHENLDRLKRNLDTMQNLQSKLYFQQLLTAALKEIRNKLAN